MSLFHILNDIGNCVNNNLNDISDRINENIIQTFITDGYYFFLYELINNLNIT